MNFVKIFNKKTQILRRIFKVRFKLYHVTGFRIMKFLSLNPKARWVEGEGANLPLNPLLGFLL